MLNVSAGIQHRHWSSTVELRRFSRYNLSTPLTGLIEHGDERCTGSLINISQGGFLLHLPSAPATRLATYGTGDYGEIHYAGNNAHGFGQLVRVEHFAKGVCVAFSWDADEVSKAGCALIDRVIEEQTKMRQAGSVSISATTISLGGHVSSALAAEIFLLLKKTGAANARISLRNCASIDSSGIEMLITLRDMGAPIIDAGAKVRDVMQRFQLLPADGSELAGS